VGLLEEWNAQYSKERKNAMLCVLSLLVTASFLLLYKGLVRDWEYRGHGNIGCFRAINYVQKGRR
jgi:hypothetical protein